MEYNNSTFGLRLEYPAMWTVDAQLQGDNPYNSMCDPATGTCFNIIVPVESGFTDDNLNEVSSIFLNSSIDSSLANYTIDGEKAEVFTTLSTIRGSDVVAERQNIIAIHDGRIYFLFLSGYPIEVSKTETKEILDHIIKSFNWTTTNPNSPTNNNYSRNDAENIHGDFIPSCSGDYYHPCK
jgi:hypothetical protein